jgi:hypothetical protein
VLEPDCLERQDRPAGRVQQVQVLVLQVQVLVLRLPRHRVRRDLHLHALLRRLRRHRVRHGLAGLVR